MEDNPTPFDQLRLFKNIPVVENLMEVIEKAKKKVHFTETNKLFLVYIYMDDLLLRNLHAERLGDWDEYLTSLTLMVQNLAGTGHRAYTNSEKNKY